MARTSVSEPLLEVQGFWPTHGIGDSPYHVASPMDLLGFEEVQGFRPTHGIGDSPYHVVDPMDSLRVGEAQGFWPTRSYPISDEANWKSVTIKREPAEQSPTKFRMLPRVAPPLSMGITIIGDLSLLRRENIVPDKRNQQRKRTRSENPATHSKSPFIAIYEDSHSSEMILKSGTVVEQVLLRLYRAGEESTLLNALIFNIAENSLHAKLFENEDWAEIKSAARTTEIVPLMQCLSCIPDDIVSAKSLRNVLYGQQDVGSDQQWVDAAYKKILFLMELADQPLTRPHNESWWEIMLHGDLIYRCLLSIEKMNIVTKETISQATKAFVNQGRTETGKGHHLIPSPRLDCIFRLNKISRLELGGIEVARDNNGLEDTKRINDFNKLAVTLSHMLRRLHREVKSTQLENMSVIGILCSGLTIQVLRMSSRNGRICVLSVDDPVIIPCDESRIRDMKRVLQAISDVRDSLQHTIKIVLEAR